MRLTIIGAGGRLMLFAAALTAGGAAHAADPELGRCLTVSGDAARLTCFETLARQRNAEPESAIASAPATAAPPAAAAPPASRRAEFGLSTVEREERRPERERQLDKLTAVVAAIRPFGAGYWSILTEDGATWRISEARQSFRPPRAGDTIALERAALGSYLLLFEGQSIRAKRLN